MKQTQILSTVKHFKCKTQTIATDKVPWILSSSVYIIITWENKQQEYRNSRIQQKQAKINTEFSI